MNWNSYKRHYAEPDDQEEEYLTGHGSDDGYDAIKDANAEIGLRHDDPRGITKARNNGWLRKANKKA